MIAWLDHLLDEQDGDRELYDRHLMLMTDLAPHATLH